MKHPRFTAWLCSAAALVLLAVPAFAQQPDALPPEQTAPAAQEQTAEAAAPDAEAPTAEAPAADPQRTYVALGDSIVSGVGLPDFKYTEAAIGIDAAPNFEGYPEQCYVSLVGKGLGLDRQHAINLGLPGLTTGDLADMLHTGAMPQMNQQAGTYYVYPQMLDYLKRADVISVQIGSNDALVPALVALGNATNWKSEQLVATMVSGVLREPSFENLQRLNSDLSRLRLTREEKQATTQLLLGGGTDAICEQAYQEAAVHMPQVVAELRALNPDAQIILLGYTNPVPLLPEWTQLFRRLNALSKSLAAQNENVTYVPIPGVLREPSFENLQRLNSDLSRLRLTREEKQATTQLLLGGGTDAICEQAYQEAAVHMPQVVAELRALNPDAQIILLGYTNPVPLLPEWTQLFRRLNALSKSLAAQNENVTYVPIPFAMTAADAHPTVSGHKYIANRILRAIKK